ncbi:MAG TPA: nucleotidyltransferase family protein [Pyrinomonadaceae bacterium]|nr:nucleotidyltransferase family protein [Pyrinomonadaceae bacterium]
MSESPLPNPRTPDSRLTTPDFSVAAIILAAGRSSRMGAFKPLLPFGSKTVVETCIDNLRAGGVEQFVIVIGQDKRAAELKERLRNLDLTFAVNPDPHSEMNASIACGVDALSAVSKVVVINPVDHAAVPGDVVRQVIAEWKNGALLVKPTCNQRGGHPVLVDLSFREELLQLDPNTGLKAFFNQHQALVRRVEVKTNLIARDMDTWDDYAALHREVFGVSPPNSPFQSA